MTGIQREAVTPLTSCHSADIMASPGVHIHVNDFSKTARPRDMLLILKDTLSIEDEKLFKACRSFLFFFVCSPEPLQVGLPRVTEY